MRYKGLAEVPYNYAAAAPAGAMLFTAGACPLDAEGKVVASGDHRAQAEKAVENPLAVLARRQAGPEHLLKTTVYVVGDRRDLVAVWDVVAACLEPYRPPAPCSGLPCWVTSTNSLRSTALPRCRAEPAR